MVDIETAKDWHHNLWKIPNDIYICYVEYAEELPKELLKDVHVDGVEYVGFFYEKRGTYLVFVIEDVSHDPKIYEKHMKSLFNLYFNDKIVKGHFPSSTYRQDVMFDRHTCPCEHCKEHRTKKFKPLTVKS